MISERLSTKYLYGISLRNTKSYENNIGCGVYQGSFLGPVLISLYITDIVNASNNFKFLLFAYETDILYSSEEPETAENILNK